MQAKENTARFYIYKDARPRVDSLNKGVGGLVFRFGNPVPSPVDTWGYTKVSWMGAWISVNTMKTSRENIPPPRGFLIRYLSLFRHTHHLEISNDKSVLLIATWAN
jgi:hypothetical protein